MSQPFFVAPYKPTEWEKASIDLEIDPTVYREHLQNKWPSIVFYEAESGTLLAWGILGSGNNRIYGALQDNHQIIWLEFPLDEFFLWHRSVIPAKYPLFLFRSSSWDSIELTSETVLEDILRFTGKTT